MNSIDYFIFYTLWLWPYIRFVTHAAASAKSLQSCPTLCDPIDGSPTGSPIPGILQARTLEWVAISFSSAWKWKVKVKSLSHVRLLAPPWTAAYQAPPSIGFSRQEYWSGVPLPSPIYRATLYQYCRGVVKRISLWGTKLYALDWLVSSLLIIYIHRYQKTLKNPGK